MELGIDEYKIDEVFTRLGIAYGDLVTSDQLRDVVKAVITENNEAIKQQLEGFFEAHMNKFIEELAREARNI